MAAADLNAIRATVEGRLATELAGSPLCLWCLTTWRMSQRQTALGCNV